jgi:hypothetical protein
MHRATGKLVLLATLTSCRAAVAKAAHESAGRRTASCQAECLVRDGSSAAFARLRDARHRSRTAEREDRNSSGHAMRHLHRTRPDRVTSNRDERAYAAPARHLVLDPSAMTSVSRSCCAPRIPRRIRRNSVSVAHHAGSHPSASPHLRHRGRKQCRPLLVVAAP